MKMNKTSSVAAVVSATLALTGLASQNAVAATKHKHHHHKASSQLTPSVRTIERAEDARLARMDAEIAELRAQLSNQKHESTQVAAKQQQLETQVAEEAAKESAKNNLVFFRGGYASLTSNRDNELLTSGNNAGLLGAYSPNGGNGNGWYVGAGMDFRASDDFFGLSDMVALDAELMFSYSNFGQSTNAFVSAMTGTTVRNQITMFTLAASPKVKFNLADGDFRPWIIPFGLAINVVSPPSSGVTVLNPGLMLGTGMEYRIWENLWVGTDFRYQFTGGDLNYKTNYGNGTVLNQTPTQGLQAGAYVGVGF